MSTAARLLLGKGIHAKIVIEQLDHAKIAMILNRYSHVTPAMPQRAADPIVRSRSG